MADAFNFPGNYRIEISGWGLDNTFFVEKTDLLWSPTGEKHILLHRALAEGAMVFVRLLAEESIERSAPVAFEVKNVRPMDADGECEMCLMKLQPRVKKAPIQGEWHLICKNKMNEVSSSAGRPANSSTQRETEEILQ